MRINLDAIVAELRDSLGDDVAFDVPVADRREVVERCSAA
jgi:hypothetical protein